MEYIASNDNNEYRFYVYAWQYPDGRTFYVGKGCGNRDRDEKSGHRSKNFKSVVAKIRREGGEPRIVRWQEGLREDDAHAIEVAYIKLFGRRDLGSGALVNFTAGGEGASGMRHTEDAKAKIGLASARLYRSDEWRAAIGKAHSGKQISAEQRNLLRVANTGNKHSLETRMKMSVSQTGNKHNLGRKASPETVEKHRRRQLMALPRSGYKGVTFSKAIGKFCAGIQIDGRQTHLGVFLDQEQAALAYDRAAYAAWGDKCYLNFGIPKTESA